MRRAGWTAAKILLPIVLLCAAATGALYTRLLLGPLSAKFLVDPITQGISDDLPALDVAVQDVVLSLGDDGTIEVQLRNIRLSEQDGAPVAAAPLALVDLSYRGLWRGRLTPSKIVFVEPRFLLFQSETGGLSFTVSPPRDLAAGPPKEATTRPEAAAPTTAQDERDDDNGAGLPRALRELDLARVFAEAMARARRGTDASAFLREVGLRNASVILHRENRRSLWQIPEARVVLEHKKWRSIIAGSLTVASPRGPWVLDFRTEDSSKTRSIAVNASVRNLVPRVLAESAPELSLLSLLDAPVAVDATLELTTAGELHGGLFRLNLGAGTLHLPGTPGTVIAAEAGQLELRYDRQQGWVDLVPSTLVWGQSQVTVAGKLASVTGEGGEEVWEYDIKATEGVLAAEEFGVAGLRLEQGSFAGRIHPKSSILEIVQIAVQAGGAKAQLAGSISLAAGAPGMRLAGRLGTMSPAALKALWPRSIAPGARAWVGERVSAGTVQGGTIEIVSGARFPEPGQSADPPEADRMSVTLEATDVQFVAVPGLPPILAPRALVRLEGDIMEVTIPESFIGQTGRRLTLRSGRFLAGGVKTDEPRGEFSFKVAGSLPAALELLDSEPLALLSGTGIQPDGVDGKVEGQFNVTLPLEANIAMRDVKIEGKARVFDGRARHLIGTFDAQGGSIAFDVEERAVEARGQVLLAGVPVKIAWQHIVGATADKQPPLRLSAKLDTADRSQLGLDVNHIVQGEMGVEMTIVRGVNGEPAVHVRTDLTNADLVLESLAWRKPPGRPALLQFDVVKGTRHPTELTNFKLAGDDIAVDGWVGVDAQNRLKEFVFTDFALKVVSRLEVSGVMRSDNVVEVKAKGQVFDGRDFFKNLFSVGMVGDKPLPLRKDQPGLDLEADIDTVLGFSEVSMRNFSLQMSKRAGRLASLNARGIVDGGRPVDVAMQSARNEPRRLVAISEDAGQVFKLAGFYPNLKGGTMRLTVNLDGKGPAEKTGLLEVRNFQILGDPVVNDVLRTPDEAGATSTQGRPGPRTYSRQAFDFQWMNAPFSVGHGQFVLEDAELRGPVFGVTLRGKVDFRAQRLLLGGTYAPLQGLNAVPAVIPGLGQILAGQRGEGMFGMTFAIQGPMAQPEVIVNPFSVALPGIFRDLFPMTNPYPRVTPRDEKPKKSPEAPSRASSAPAAGRAAAPEVSPEISGGWSSETTTPTRKKSAP